jgi:hypothetical protein
VGSVFTFRLPAKAAVLGEEGLRPTEEFTSALVS